MTTSIVRRMVALGAATACALGGLALGAGTAGAAEAQPDPYTITVKAAQADRGGTNSLKGRKFTAYKLADYVDRTYVSVGDKQLDGVAVDTPDDLKPILNKVLAKTAGVSDVTKLPGWAASTNQAGDQQPGANAGGDPIGWMGGFRQTPAGQGATGDDQASGYFGYGWNESGPKGIGGNSPSKAYTGTVREFADNLAKDLAANAADQAVLDKYKANAKPVECTAADACTIPVTKTGVYLILDTGGVSQGTYKNAYGFNGTWTVGTTQPMIVPTRPDDADVATMDGYKPSDRTKLGTTGTLGEIVVKNVADEEELPHYIPKQRDETVNPGKDAADNGNDVGDTIPYVVSYRVADMSAYKAALDNGDPWSYEYRVLDYTQPGLKITGAPTVDLYGPEANLYDANGKVVSKDKVTGADGKTVVQPKASIKLTQVDQIPAYAAKGQGTATGQNGQPDAWYYLSVDQNTDETHMIVGLGKWIVKNYGNLKLNGKTDTTLYGSQFAIRYTALITPKILAHQNMTHNENWLDYTDTPHDVNSGSHHSTPHVIIRQWTYDIDLKKKSSTGNVPLPGAEFKVTVKDNANAADAKANGSELKFVKVVPDGKNPDVYYYRLPVAGETANATRVVTGRDGLLSIKGLDLGTYTLTETKAPRNYRLLDKSEDVKISAKFTDDKTNFTTPDYQTESRLTISKNNSIIPLVKPMFNFAATQAQAPKGLTITATDAYWSGQEGGKYIADDKTNWVDTQLTLWNQPINVMLAQTGGVIGFGAIVVIGAGLTIGGFMLLARRRHEAATGAED